MLKKISGFDRVEKVYSTIERPDSYAELFKALDNGSYIPRGSGLSYCIASAAANGRSISSTLFNRILEFNVEEKRMRVESGVILGDILNIAQKHQLIPPVLPGSPNVTLGGAIAFNIHGKNQHLAGNISEHISQIRLVHPLLGDITCSREKNAEIFELTLGGMGLTGFIISADLMLTSAKGNAIEVEKIFAKDLLETGEILLTCSHKSDYLYSWHNLNRKGNRFGSGIIYSESYTNLTNDMLSEAMDYEKISDKFTPRIALLNNHSLPPILHAYELKEKFLKRKPKILSIHQALFPMASKGYYFNLYGKKGFREYQMLIPIENWQGMICDLEKIFEKKNCSVGLASLKLFKGSRNLLNFTGDGYSFAINVPNNKDSLELFALLDQATIRWNGISNLAKDSRISSCTISRMYGEEYKRFQRSILNIDPKNLLDSELRRRIFEG